MSNIGIEGFEATGVLGSGAVGTVYRAYDRGHDRDVALKVVPVGNEAARGRFNRERVSLGRLSAHAGIVDVYASGFTTGGDAYIVMPVVEGGSLRDRLNQDKSIPWAEAAALMETVADSVAAGHGAGVVHGDLKPSNILVGSDGAPLVADFGVSILTGGEEEGTGYTPAFAAPELFYGGAPTVATDVYALGATLYALITGESVHGDTTGPAVALAHRASRSKALRLDAALAPHDLADVVAKCLAIDAADRPEANEVAEELRSVNDLDATVTQPRTTPASPRPRRRRLALVAVAAVGVLLLGTLISAQMGDSNGDASAEPSAPTTATPTSAPPPTSVVAESPNTTAATTTTTAVVVAAEPVEPWIDTVSYVGEGWAVSVSPLPGHVLTPTLDGSTVWVATGAGGDNGENAWRRLDLATLEVLAERVDLRFEPTTPAVVSDRFLWYIACCDLASGNDVWMFGVIRKDDLIENAMALQPIVRGRFREPVLIGRHYFVGDGVAFPHEQGMFFLEADVGPGEPGPPPRDLREFTGSPEKYPSNRHVGLTPVSPTGLGILRHKDGSQYFDPTRDVVTLEPSTIGTVTPYVHVAPDGSVWLVTQERKAVRGEFGGVGVTDMVEAGPCPVDESEGFGICVAPETGEAVLGHGALWVPNVGDDNVYRIDLESRDVSHVIAVGRDPGTPVLGDDAVWVVNTGDATVSRIDAVSKRVSATIPLMCGQEACEPWPAGVVREHRPLVVGHRVFVPWNGALAVIAEAPGGAS